MSNEASDTHAAPQGAEQCFMDYLAGEGFRPEIDKDGDIHFKCEGKHYYVIAREKDRQFVQLLYPHFWSIDSEEEGQRAVVAANLTTSRCKCCKVFVSDEQVHAAIELFVAEPGHATAVLDRALGALQHGVNAFVEEMRKEE